MIKVGSIIIWHKAAINNSNIYSHGTREVLIGRAIKILLYNSGECRSFIIKCPDGKTYDVPNITEYIVEIDPDDVAKLSIDATLDKSDYSGIDESFFIDG